ncbi:MAG: YkgJ family cysteine cluster protein [Promethearchaeota archaeon]
MINSKSLKFQCIHCGNCCTDQTTFINLTYHDIIRLKDGLKLTLAEIIQCIGFYIFEKGFTKKDLKKLVISPIETKKGLAFVGLLKNQDGTCFFYKKEKKRCSIYPLRPAFCRTFPFTFRMTENEGIEIFYTEKAKAFCQGISHEAPEIDLDYWKNLGDNVLANLKENEIFISNWNKLVKDGRIDPTVKNLILMILNLSSKN